MAQADPNRLDLESYLITPIQRLPRYVLLLAELRKFSDPTHADYTFLIEATQELGAVASGVDAYMKAKEAAFSDDPEVAMLEYSKALTSNPYDVHLLLCRAIACLKIGEAPLLEAGLVDLTTVTTLKPRAYKGWSVLGETLLALGRPKEAEEAFSMALSLPGSAMRPELSAGLARAHAALLRHQQQIPEGIPGT